MYILRTTSRNLKQLLKIISPVELDGMKIYQVLHIATLEVPLTTKSEKDNHKRKEKLNRNLRRV